MLIWANLAVNIRVSYEVSPSGQTMETIVTFGLWGANNVWSNLVNGLKGLSCDDYDPNDKVLG